MKLRISLVTLFRLVDALGNAGVREAAKGSQSQGL
jgi:hypothetical protein